MHGEEALEVPRARASAPVPTRRLALSVRGASQSHMFQISLLLTGNCVVNEGGEISEQTRYRSSLGDHFSCTLEQLQGSFEIFLHEDAQHPPF